MTIEVILRPVKAGNTFEQTVERLAQAIKLGAVLQGERLPPERELAERLNVSRVTLREAIKALHAAGFVESRRGRTGGTFVVYDTSLRQSATPEITARIMGPLLHDALAFRRVVEPGAAELAARQKLDLDQRSRLETALESVSTARPTARRTADSQLHLLVAELSGSASLAVAVADVQARLDDMLAAIPVLARNIEHSDNDHVAFVEAILARRPARARKVMEAHVESTAALLRGFLA